MHTDENTHRIQSPCLIIVTRTGDQGTNPSLLISSPNSKKGWINHMTLCCSSRWCCEAPFFTFLLNVHDVDSFFSNKLKNLGMIHHRVPVSTKEKQTLRTRHQNAKTIRTRIVLTLAETLELDLKLRWASSVLECLLRNYVLRGEKRGKMRKPRTLAKCDYRQHSRAALSPSCLVQTHLRLEENQILGWFSSPLLLTSLALARGQSPVNVPICDALEFPIVHQRLIANLIFGYFSNISSGKTIDQASKMEEPKSNSFSSRDIWVFV